MGEGKFIGRRYIFVRFKGCPLNCIYCDEYKKDNLNFRVEEIPGSGIFKEYNNTITDNDIINNIENLKTSDLFAVSFTGGEPLLYIDKIKEYNEILQNLNYKTHLESNGIYPDKLDNIHFNYASIDLKLKEHFKNISDNQYNKLYLNELKTIEKLYNNNSNVYGKVVIMETTNVNVLKQIAKDLSNIGNITLCIQPVSPFDNIKPPQQNKLLKIMEVCGEYLGDNVICTSQIHKYLNML